MIQWPITMEDLSVMMLHGIITVLQRMEEHGGISSVIKLVLS